MTTTKDISLSAQLKELWQFRELITTFVWRDLKTRYRQTSLGIMWTIIQPLFMTIVFTVIFSKFLKVSTNGIPYPVFSYLALATWTFISRSIASGPTNIIANYGIFAKVYFPREVIPLSSIISALIDFFVASLVYLLLLAIYGVSLSWHLIFLPVILLAQIMLAIALTLFSAGTTVIFRDLQFAYPFFIQLLMYGSPIIYSVRNLQEKYKLLFYFNPITGIVEGYRSIFLYHEVPNFIYLGISIGFSLIFLPLSYWLFKRIERYLADVV
jgi:lipopolysaccharide transport system permease protein